MPGTPGWNTQGLGGGVLSGRQPERKGASRLRTGPDGDVSTLQPGKKTRDGQSEAGPTKRPAPRAVDPIEPVKNLLLMFERDSRTGIAYVDGTLLLGVAHRDGDRSLICVTYGVGYEVDENVPSPIDIADRPSTSVHLDMNREILRRSHGHGDLTHVIDQLPNFKVLAIHVELTVLAPGNEEQIFDHLGHAFEFPLDRLEGLALFGGLAPLAERPLHLGSKMGQRSP